jgi:hypothetical protein
VTVASDALKNAALDYARRGWHVFPLHGIVDGACTCGNASCDNAGKHPRTRNGLKDATSDPDDVAYFWDKHPDANIGLVTGPSRLAVVDIDTDDARSVLEEHLPLEKLAGGPVVRTARGWHLYFADPDARARPSVGIGTHKGIDLRAGDSYVVAPPSLHASGHVYEQIRNGDAPSLPREVRAYFEKRSRRAELADGDAAPIPQGQRDVTLFSLASSMRRRGHTEAEIRAALTVANQDRCDPPLDPRDVRRIARSAARYAPGAPELMHIEILGHEPATDADADDTYRLLTNHDIDELADPEWLIDGALPRYGFGVHYGPSGAYKTFDVADLGLAVSLGLPWHGRETKQGAVIYVLAEGVGGFKRRRHAWLRHRNVHDTPDFHLLPTVVPITDPACLNKLIRTAAQLDQPPALIIIDTLARSMPGSDENATKDMSEVVAAIDKLRENVGCGVHLVHHTGHDTSRERGNTALRAAADTMIRTTKNADGIVTVKCDKQKDADEFGPDHLTFHEVVLTDSGVLVSTDAPAGVEDGQRRARAEDIAAYVIAQPNHRAWPRQIKDEFGIGDEALRERRYALRQQGIAYISADRKSRYVASSPAHRGGLLEEDIRALQEAE